VPVIPPPYLPHIQLPTIRGIPSLPHIGCVGARGTTYQGQQHGHLPDVGGILHLRAMRKFLNEQIYALIQGELPDSLRPAPYAVRAAQLVDEVTEAVASMNELISSVVGEIGADLSYVQGQINTLNSAMAEVQAVPANSRTAAQAMTLTLYTEYVSELNSQATRLQASLSCIAS
jgi:hypothetical protein